MNRPAARPVLMGFEQELALVVDTADQPVNYDALLARTMELAAGSLVNVRAVGESGIFTGNASRLYVDCQKLEYASPECSDPTEIVLYCAAAERIVAKLAEQLRRDKGLTDAAFVRCQVAYGTDATWGHHESYLTRTLPVKLADDLVPFQVSRVVTAGGGGFVPMTDAGCSFTLSTRASHMGKVISSSSTSTHERGIFHLREQTLAREGYHRLHCLVGENLCSHKAEWLRAGSTALVVAMADAGIGPGLDVQLADPVLAINQISADPTCKMRVCTKRGQLLSAVEIQRHYLKLARESRKAPWMPGWAEEVIDVWDDMLNRLAGAPDSVANCLDWAIKYRAYSTRLARHDFDWALLGHWSAMCELLMRCRRLSEPESFESEGLCRADLLKESSPIHRIAVELAPHMAARGMSWDQFDRYAKLRQELFTLDFRFGRCGEAGIFNILDRQGVLDHRIAGVDEAAIERAMTQPPAYNRSRLRGEAIRRLSVRGSPGGANWEMVIDSARGVALDLKDPFASEERWIKTALSSIAEVGVPF